MVVDDFAFDPFSYFSSIRIAAIFDVAVLTATSIHSRHDSESVIWCSEHVFESSVIGLSVAFHVCFLT